MPERSHYEHPGMAAGGVPDDGERSIKTTNNNRWKMSISNQAASVQKPARCLACLMPKPPSTKHRFPSSSSSSSFIFHHGSIFFQGIFYHRSVPHQLQKPFWLLALLVWLPLDAHELLVWFLLDVLELQMIYEPSLYLSYQKQNSARS